MKQCNMLPAHIEQKLPDAIFWDWDGTIVDSFDLICRAHSYARVTLGFKPLYAEEFRTYFGKPKSYIYETFYNDKQDEAFALFMEYAFKHGADIHPFKEAEQTLHYLHDKGVILGLVTNKKREIVEKEIERLSMNHLFSVLVCATEATEDKPSADPLLHAIQLAGLNQTKIITYGMPETQKAICFALNEQTAHHFL